MASRPPHRPGTWGLLIATFVVVVAVVIVLLADQMMR